jgi:hypothetical protein
VVAGGDVCGGGGGVALVQMLLYTFRRQNWNSSVLGVR